MSVLPPVDQATLPADIRNASENVRQQYQVALSFERQLTAQLAKQLSATTGASTDGSPYADLLPDALADAVTAAGGLGLARGMVDTTATGDAA